MCYSCRTAFYFRPFKLEPLQGSFVEIGRVKGGRESSGNDGGKNEVRVWEKLRSYSGEQEKNADANTDSNCNLEGSNVGSTMGAEGGKARKELPTPKEICKALNDFVVGQDRAKKVRFSFWNLCRYYCGSAFNTKLYATLDSAIV